MLYSLYLLCINLKDKLFKQKNKDTCIDEYHIKIPINYRDNGIV